MLSPYTSRFLFISIVMLVTSIAFADPTVAVPSSTVQSSWQLLILEHLLQLVGAVLIGVIIPAIPKLFDLFAAKTSISISSSTQERAKQIAENAVHYAEEWARTRMRAHPSLAPVKGEEKYAEASRFAIEQMEKFGVDRKMEDVVVKLVLASLHIQRPLPTNPANNEARPSQPPTVEPTQPTTVEPTNN
jgi:hypothetical protein